MDPNPISHAYEKRVPSLPPNEDTRTVWRFFEHAKMPFYIEIVHISPPWRGDMGWRAQNKEDLRVGEANAAAYLGAALVVLAVPERGDGLYSVVEQRLGTFGTYRLLPLGPWGDDTPAEEDSDPEEVTDGKDTKPFDKTVCFLSSSIIQVANPSAHTECCRSEPHILSISGKKCISRRCVFVLSRQGNM